MLSSHENFQGHACPSYNGIGLLSGVLSDGDHYEISDGSIYDELPSLVT